MCSRGSGPSPMWGSGLHDRRWARWGRRRVRGEQRLLERRRNERPDGRDGSVERRWNERLVRRGGRRFVGGGDERRIGGFGERHVQRSLGWKRGEVRLVERWLGGRIRHRVRRQRRRSGRVPGSRSHGQREMHGQWSRVRVRVEPRYRLQQARRVRERRLDLRGVGYVHHEHLPRDIRQDHGLGELRDGWRQLRIP
jgi:hypothetical protein